MHFPADPDHVVLKNVSEIFTINYSYKFANDLAIGVNGNFFNYEIGDQTFDPILLDIGVLKKFAIGGELYKQNVYAGISFNNILNQKAEAEESGYNLYEGAYSYTITEYLPSTLRISGAYEIKYDPEGWTLMPASLIASAEYQDMLNSKYYTMIKFGAELTLMEIFKTRCGFYTQSNNDHGYSENVGRLNEFTYGFGLSFPIYKLAPSVPLEINADYVNLENPTYYKPAEDAMKNYNLFTVSAKVKI
ncbi:MAG TPA: type IX secretion system membrane protein PorP/SprF [Ignavibacteriales bacterium]|nr:type IX secretion system membrane protein PorP/SprF [Ignavibacteriales bacterium]